MTTIKTTGVLRYSPKLLEKGNSSKWLVIDCNPQLGKYLRHLFYISLKSPKLYIAPSV